MNIIIKIGKTFVINTKFSEKEDDINKKKSLEELKCIKVK